MAWQYDMPLFPTLLATSNSWDHAACGMMTKTTDTQQHSKLSEIWPHAPSRFVSHPTPPSPNTPLAQTVGTPQPQQPPRDVASPQVKAQDAHRDTPRTHHCRVYDVNAS